MQSITKTLLVSRNISFQEFQSVARIAFASAALLALASVLVVPAHAQKNRRPAAIRPISAIVPSNGEDLMITQSFGAQNQPGYTVRTSYLVNDAGMQIPVPAVDAPPQPVGQPRITIDFQDVLVADLIALIAKQGDVGIIIGGDVDTRMRNVHLVDITPEEAIKQVTQTAGLKWRKINDKTFAIAKTMDELPPDNKSIAVLTPEPRDSLPLLPRKSTRSLEEDIENGSNDPYSDLPPLLNQRNAPQEADTEEERSYFYLRLRNVNPRMMAYWLDPLHNPEPKEYRDSREQLEQARPKYLMQPGINPAVRVADTGGAYTPEVSTYNPWSPAGSLNRGYDDTNPYNDGVIRRRNPQFRGGQGARGGGARGGAAGSGAGVFEMPDGVDSLIAVDPQNALLVLGTPEGIQRLQQIIGFLDRPLRQVEIEAQFVSVGHTDVNQFGIDFSSSSGVVTTNLKTGLGSDGGTFSLGFVRNNFSATLNSLVSQNRAKTVAAPRVTAINNIPASLFSTTSTPIKLTSSTQGIGGQVGTTENIFFVQTSVGLTVTPTINNDDTITVVLAPQVQSQGAPFGDTGVPSVDSNQIQTIANVRDGDTIALGGLRTKALSRGGARIPVISRIPLIGDLFRTKNNRDIETDLIIFLTARILRRVEAPVPGT